jgi:hypothetical protein
MILTQPMQKKTKELKRTLKAVSKKSPFDFPNRLWESIVPIWNWNRNEWADLSKVQLQKFIKSVDKRLFSSQRKKYF